MTKKKNSQVDGRIIAGIIVSLVTIAVAVFFYRHAVETVEPAEAASPGWIASCNYSHSLPDDPIVSPGKPEAAHLHDFFGSRITDANTAVTNLHSGDTTCVMKADKTAYWVPALFKNNVRILPTGTNKHILNYYRFPNMNAAKSMQTIPDGLKMIVGSAHASSPEDNKGIMDKHIQFKCGPGSGNDQPKPPAFCASGIMVISYEFPNCWDGKNLDSADHISHMSYPKGSMCPQTHPVAIPRVKAFIRYPVGMGPIGNITLSSGPYFTAHMDFFNGWDPTALGKLVDKCMKAGVDCGKNPAIPQ